MKYIHEWETQQNAAPSESNFQMNGCNEQNITEANQHFTKAYIGLEWWRVSANITSHYGVF